MRHVIALIVLLVAACGDKNEAPEPGGGDKEGTKAETAGEEIPSTEQPVAASGLESQVVGYWAATVEDMIKNVEEKDNRKLSSEEKTELRESMEKGEFGLLLHFPTEGTMIGYMTGEEAATMTYEVTSVDDANGILEVKVDGDAGKFAGAVTFEQNKLVLTRDDEEGSMTVSRLDKAEFDKLVPGD